MAVVRAAGAYAPATVYDNATAAAAAGVSGEWIVQRTGILERRVAAPGEGTARMGELAAREALGRAALDATDIDLIIVATSTPNHLTPPTACEVQAALGAFGAAAFDIEAGFAGWIYALFVADALLGAGSARHAIVIGAEKLSTVTDRTDPATGPLFGDGAGAVVLSTEGEGRTLGARSWWADGRLANVLLRPGGGAQRPFDERVLEEGMHLLRMEGVRLFRRAVRTMARQTEQVLERAGLQLDDVDLVVPHQANLAEQCEREQRARTSGRRIRRSAPKPDPVVRQHRRRDHERKQQERQRTVRDAAADPERGILAAGVRDDVDVGAFAAMTSVAVASGVARCRPARDSRANERVRDWIHAPPDPPPDPASDLAPGFLGFSNRACARRNPISRMAWSAQRCHGWTAG